MPVSLVKLAALTSSLMSGLLVLAAAEAVAAAVFAGGALAGGFCATASAREQPRTKVAASIAFMAERKCRKTRLSSWKRLAGTGTLSECARPRAHSARYVVRTWVTISPKDMGYTGQMPWKETNVMQERVELIGKYLGQEESVSDLAREYGLSRKTVYKWIERFEHRGAGGLQELSRAPHHHQIGRAS